MAGQEGTDRLIFVRYRDHVLYSRSSPEAMAPQVRESVGWLVYECEQYVIIAWDRDAEPPTLKGGDAKASGAVVLKTDILELEHIEAQRLPLKEKSECHLNRPASTVEDEYALLQEKRKTQRKTRGETAT